MYIFRTFSVFRFIPNTAFLFVLLTLMIAAIFTRPVAADEVIQFEAEDLNLTSYVVEDHAFASNGRTISLLGEPGSTGSGSGTFTGDEGDYIVVISYIDEEDGDSLLAFEASGKTIESWTLDQRLGAVQPDGIALTARTLQAVHFKRGDVFAILGNKGGNENASIDLIQFIPVTDIYQAEEAVLSPEAVVKSDKPGFTETGYVETSGEGTIEWIVNASVVEGSPSAADHTLEFRYAYGFLDPQALPLDIYVNDQLAVSNSPFKDTGAPSRWLSQTAVVQLKDGSNTIRVQTKDLTGPGSFMANIDYLSVTKVDYLKALGSTAPKPDPRFPEAVDPGYAGSYYGCIDPSGERSTLSSWKQLNGFDDASNTVSANYINAYDLGFGRKMACVKSNARTACYVDNFLDPKGKANFAATVTMERMEPSETCSDKSIIAFSVYDPDGNRINQLALDSEGGKSVPESCHTCHGGETVNGVPSGGAQFLPWNLDLFEDWPGEETVAAQSERFRELNDVAWSDTDRFNGDRIKSLIESWYGGRPLRGTVFNNEELFLESEDQRSPKDASKKDWFSNPKGHLALDDPDTLSQNIREESLYTNVYTPYCRACHTALQDGKDWSNATDFNRVAFSRICNKPESAEIMPHAELTDQRFKNDKFINEVGSNRSETTALEVLCGQEPSVLSSQNTAEGRSIFRAKCTQCHRSEDEAWQGAESTGSDKSCRGSTLTRAKPENDEILDLGGINPAMNGLVLNTAEVTQVSTYLNSFDRCNNNNNASGSGGFGLLSLLIVALLRGLRLRVYDYSRLDNSSENIVR